MLAFGCLELLLLLCLFITTSFALDPYQALGLGKNAEERDIKKAYRRLSKRFHPDKNPGDAEAEKRFLEIGQAYEILTDPEKRSIYDRYGEEGLKRHQQQGGNGGGFHDPFDVFSSFFGGQRGGGGGQRKGPSVMSEMEIDLEDVYSGKSIDFEINRKIICPSCSGSGARSPSDIRECPVCAGRGVRLVRHQLAPGMFQQMQMQCDHCGGRGQAIAHKCGKCQGARTVDSVNQLALEVDRGMPEGAEEHFEGEADESPDWAAGDVVIKIKTKRKVGGFRRKDSHLYWTEALRLDEALLGFTRKIKHLDGHYITLSRTAVTQPGFVQVVEGEGMPHYQSSGYGDLYIEYSVVFPAEISGSLRKQLEPALRKGHTEL